MIYSKMVTKSIMYPIKFSCSSYYKGFLNSGKSIINTPWHHVQPSSTYKVYPCYTNPRNSHIIQHNNMSADHYPENSYYFPHQNNSGKSYTHSIKTANGYKIYHDRPIQSMIFPIDAYYQKKIISPSYYNSKTLENPTYHYPLSPSVDNFTRPSSKKPKLFDTASLIFNNNIPDITTLEEPSSLSSYNNEDLSFYRDNSTIDTEAALINYEKKFKGKISLKGYFAILDYCTGDYIVK